ncbi:MAG: acetyl/propionyl/methylcrotonyl-CoA carboxylase subunit alpha [Pseudomonadota bacterium]
MFSKILIANRGEIACRVMRTAKRLGIATVAVYSDADADALHVRVADEAIRIGPAPSVESYLRIDTIVDACRSTGAQAVHPGYGFLSENAAFADALAEAGIVFVGPPVGAITAMGDKIASKKLADEAGVNTIPGYTDVVRDAAHAVEIADGIGYPVMLKASAGGGGKGMRVAYDRDGCREGFDRATSEARSSFGDDRVFIEKFIEQPRHIEIQVLADQHGSCIYLGERECSIQRRHQKVIEEAPSPFLDEATRRAMGEQAVALSRAVDYCSAGTVEFIVDKHRNFYFLEMNTRLQVEHPVTEIVTGIDLVEQMLHVAAGAPLALTQDDVQLDGWAVEARIYAEDPLRNFLPSVGRVEQYVAPTEVDGVRVDAGVYAGGEVSIFYDPMIAKLIGYGSDRPAAVANLLDALDAYVIRGPADNIAFLSAVLRHPRFASGDISTAFIEEQYPDGFGPECVTHDQPELLAAIATELEARVNPRGLGADGQATVVALSDDRKGFDATVRGEGDSRQVIVNGVAHSLQLEWDPRTTLARAEIDGTPFTLQAMRDGIDWQLRHRGYSFHARVMRPRTAELFGLMPVKAPPDLSRFLLSPMPGLLVTLSVGEGDRVEPGQDLAIVEAMKMENVLRAERAATVAAVLAQPGDNLNVDQPILEFD